MVNVRKPSGTLLLKIIAKISQMQKKTVKMSAVSIIYLLFWRQISFSF